MGRAGSGRRKPREIGGKGQGKEDWLIKGQNWTGQASSESKERKRRDEQKRVMASSDVRTSTHLHLYNDVGISHPLSSNGETTIITALYIMFFPPLTFWTITGFVEGIFYTMSPDKSDVS